MFRFLLNFYVRKLSNLIERYSNGKEIGFWSLSKGYDKYFNLIVQLLEDENLNFNSCRVNFKDKNTPKLLTLSSIIFLNYCIYLLFCNKRFRLRFVLTQLRH